MSRPRKQAEKLPAPIKEPFRPKPVPADTKAFKRPPKKGTLPIWQSDGLRKKPQACKKCHFRGGGAGFVPDWYPDDKVAPKIGFMLAHPTSNDVLEQKPWSGPEGIRNEFEYLRPFGLSRYSVYLGYVIRCLPKDRRFGKAVYPGGSIGASAERACRAYDGLCWDGPRMRDGGLLTLDPDIFVVTFDPHDAVETPALRRLIKSDIGRAVRLMEKGRRVLVLMGDEAKDLVAPWMTGSVKHWRGNYWEGTWKFKEGPPVGHTFVEV